MPGCRALKKEEVLSILNVLKNRRDKALFILGVKSGFRISELLSLKISDVYQFGAIVDRVRIQAKYMKGKERTREVVLNGDAKKALTELIESYPSLEGYLFKSREGMDRPISGRHATTILKDAYNTLKLNGKLSTHSMRKTFAETVYRLLNKDIYKTSKAMGHASIDSTAKYLSVNQDEIDRAILKG